jgi:hypothetical protein
LVTVVWQRQAKSSELADGVQAQSRAIGKLALAAATHRFSVVGALHAPNTAGNRCTM